MRRKGGEVNEQRTFITHLEQVKWDNAKLTFNIDGSKIKVDPNKFPEKKNVSKVDEKRETLLENAEFIIKYLIKLRRFPFVCQTQRPNGVNLNVIDQFYVDEKGNSFSDAEQ